MELETVTLSESARPRKTKVCSLSSEVPGSKSSFVSTQPGGAAETRKVKREPGGEGEMERGLVDCKSSERENKKTCFGDLLLESKKVSKRQKERGEAEIPGRMCEKFIRYHYLFTQLHTTHLSLCVHT